MRKNLIITNTQYQKRRGKLWTYTSPGGNQYQLDYILARRKWRNSVKNAEAYSTFASVGSDHRIVSARIKLSLRKSEKLPRKKQYDWKTLSMDTSLQEKYAVEVRNRFEVLGVEEESATDRYDRFIKANKEAAEKIVPLRTIELRKHVSTAIQESQRLEIKSRMLMLSICRTLLMAIELRTRKQKIVFRNCTIKSLRKT